MASYTLKVNGETCTVDADPDAPLLWVLRDLLGLTGHHPQRRRADRDR